MKQFIFSIIFLLYFISFSLAQSCAVITPSIFPLSENGMAGSDLFNVLNTNTGSNNNVPIYVSKNSGRWDNPDTWCCPYSNCGTFNLPEDNLGSLVLIQDGHNVLIDHKMNYTPNANGIKLIRVEGKLLLQKDSDTKLFAETIQIMETQNELNGEPGELRIGSGNAPLTKTAEISFIRIGSNAIDTNVDPKRISRGLISYGDAKIRIFGAAKESRVLIEDVLADEYEINLLNNLSVPNSWKVGDHIVLPGTVFERREDAAAKDSKLQDEIFTIASIAGSTITLNGNTEYNHKRINDNNGLPFELHLVNLSRNLVIKTEDPANHDVPNSNMNKRAHTMFMGKGDVIIKHVLFKDLGRTNKARPLNDIIVDGPGAVGTSFTPGSNANTRGRYAVHFHQNQYAITDANGITFTTPSHVSGSVVWGTPGWGFVNHSSNVDFDDNICYDFVGSGFVTESGDEIGSFTNNIAIKGLGDNKYREIRVVFNSAERPLPLSDFAFAGDGFWFQGPMIKVKDNIASSCNGAGMIWFTIGALNIAKNRFIGVDRAIAGEIYDGYEYESSCSSSSSNTLNSSHFDTTSINYANTPIDPRTLEDEDIMTDNHIFLSDLPILECSGFQAYGCLAGFRMRFSNAPSTFIFSKQYVDDDGDYFSYTKDNINCATNISCGVGLNGNKTQALRVSQKVSNLDLWNNEMGMRIRYVTKTNFNDVQVANEVRYDPTFPYIGIETDHRLDQIYYCSTDVRGYPMSHTIIVDSPQTPCEFEPSEFDDNTCDVTNSVIDTYDNYGVFCPVPSNVSVYKTIPALSNDGNATIQWEESVYTDNIGLRYKHDDDDYWTYKWDLVATSTNNEYIITGLNSGKYEFQLISGCLESTIGVNGYFPYDNDDCINTHPLNTHPDEVGKSSYWSEINIFEIPCSEIICSTKKNSEPWVEFASNITNEIVACLSDNLELKILNSSSNTIADVEWYAPNGVQLIDNNSSNNQTFELTPIPMYGLYTAYFTDDMGTPNDLTDDCINSKVIEIIPEEEIYMGYGKSSSDFIPTNVVYTCMNNGWTWLKVDPTIPIPGFSFTKWTDENGNTISTNSCYNITGNNDLILKQVCETMYQTYTVHYSDGSCTISGQITVAPEGNITCRISDEENAPANNLIPGIEWMDALNCSIAACPGDDFSIQMFFQGSDPTITESKWTYNAGTINAPIIVEIPGSLSNSLKFDNFPQIRLPNHLKNLQGNYDYSEITVNGASILNTSYSQAISNQYLNLGSINNSDGTGIYQVIITDQKGCETSREFNIDVCSPRLANPIEEPELVENNKISLKIFPNPINSNRQLNLSFIAKNERKENFHIYDISGKLVKTENTFISEGKNTIQININNLPQGMYYISNGKELNGKFIVMN